MFRLKSQNRARLGFDRSPIGNPWATYGLGHGSNLLLMDNPCQCLLTKLATSILIGTQTLMEEFGTRLEELCSMD